MLMEGVGREKPIILHQQFARMSLHVGQHPHDQTLCRQRLMMVIDPFKQHGTRQRQVVGVTKSSQIGTEHTSNTLLGDDFPQGVGALFGIDG
jgi:hypothetical protein